MYINQPLVDQRFGYPGPGVGGYGPGAGYGGYGYPGTGVGPYGGYGYPGPGYGPFPGYGYPGGYGAGPLGSPLGAGLLGLGLGFLGGELLEGPHRPPHHHHKRFY
ncbi:hypothetical protein ACFSCX_13220 [Bacillus salitolerans]|uniref:Spore coat protein n=1 Tax=Bacillus salitolerans TaxID=1437434 RepID=A0ABW4LRW9_9BACI